MADLGLLRTPIRSLAGQQRKRIKVAFWAGRAVDYPADVQYAISHGWWTFRRFRLAAVVFFALGTVSVLIEVLGTQPSSVGSLYSAVFLIMLSAIWCYNAFNARRSIRLNEAFRTSRGSE